LAGQHEVVAVPGGFFPAHLAYPRKDFSWWGIDSDGTVCN
jgi:hypothetical protein